MMTVNWFRAPAPVARRVRAYFAPVNRATQTPVHFDPAAQGDFALDSPPTPWVDLGWIQNFTRKSTSKTAPLLTGIPAVPLDQVRETLEAHVSFEFFSWTKLTMALATGSQHMNLLTGGAVEAQQGSTASLVQLGTGDENNFAAGSMIAVDADYSGQTGFVGAPISGAYVRQPIADQDYIRRVTFNVGLVASVTASSLTLATPLPGGAPASNAKIQAIAGFVDREGGSFYQEWSGLFVVEGTQSERIFFHYPRLQSAVGAEEMSSPLDTKHSTGLARTLLKSKFMALPVTDPMDGERVLCYRSFLPAPNALI